MDWGLGAPNILYIKFKPSCSILDNVKPLDLTQNHVLSHWNIPLVHSDSLAMHPPAESSTKSKKKNVWASLLEHLLSLSSAKEFSASEPPTHGILRGFSG